MHKKIGGHWATWKNDIGMKENLYYLIITIYNIHSNVSSVYCDNEWMKVYNTKVYKTVPSFLTIWSSE